jgi:hypothetical protein
MWKCFKEEFDGVINDPYFQIKKLVESAMVRYGFQFLMSYQNTLSL